MNKLMRLLIVFISVQAIITASAFATLVKTIESSNTVSELTIMVYMAGNNNLSDATSLNINDAKKAGTPQGVSMTFLKAVKYPEQSMLIALDGKKLSELPVSTINSSHPGTLYNFVKWSKKVRPAKKYMLILWDHGFGWISRGKTKPHSPSTDFATWKKAIAEDETEGTEMSILQIRNVLETLKNKDNISFDVIGFDACFMGTIEVAYEFSSYAKVIIGSEEAESSTGWPYGLFLKYLSSTDPEYIGKLAVAAYIKSNQGLAAAHPDVDFTSTMTSINAAKLKFAVEKVIPNFVKDISQKVSKTQFINAAKRTQSFTFKTPYIDAFGFFKELQMYAPDSAEAATRATADAIISTGNFQKDVKNAVSFTIYVPFIRKYEKYRGEYNGLAFSKKTRWGNLILNYFGN